MSDLSTAWETKPKSIFILLLGVVLAALGGWATGVAGLAIPVLLLAASLLVPFVLMVLRRPELGLRSFVVYGFFITFLGRYIADLPFLYGIEALLVLTWIGVLCNAKRYNWKNLNSDLLFLGLFWFFVTVMELANPEAGSFLGWISDARYPFLWVLCVPLVLLLFNTQRELNIFLGIILLVSLLAAFYGIKQLKFGLSGAEREFLRSSPTHLVFGKLRVFSFYQDAGQFGASMAHFAVISLVLALGPFRAWKKMAFLAAGLVFVYAMFISGTRGAIFALFSGMLVALFVNRNIKVLLTLLIILIGSFVFLKYTTLLQGNAEIRRMRTAFNQNDPSLNVRLTNQEKLAGYLDSRPFGAGIGSIGYAGKTYNRGSYLASIPPDSYWVKIWAMYGIVGLVIWIGIMMYIIGKCCGIAWTAKDKQLKSKLTALTAGATGIFFCSYGNEVMNNLPSAVVIYISWTFVFLGPKLDRRENVAPKAM